MSVLRHLARPASAADDEQDAVPPACLGRRAAPCPGVVLPAGRRPDPASDLRAGRRPRTDHRPPGRSRTSPSRAGLVGPVAEAVCRRPPVSRSSAGPRPRCTTRPQVGPAGPGPPPRRRRSIHVSEPVDGLPRSRTSPERPVDGVALRLEGLDGRWQCTPSSRLTARARSGLSADQPDRPGVDRVAADGCRSTGQRRAGRGRRPRVGLDHVHDPMVVGQRATQHQETG